MSFYQVSSRNIRTGRDELLGLNEKLKTEKETLCSCELNLKNMWQGEASEQFHQAFLRDVSMVDAFYRLIMRYGEVLETVANRYDSAEQKNLAVAGRTI